MEVNGRKSLFIVLLSLIPFFSILFLWQHSIVLNIFFLLVILSILFIEKNPTDIAFVLILFVSCGLLEITAVHLGIWTHTLPDFLGIPLWIPLGWALFGLLAHHLYIVLTQFKSLTI